MRKTPFFLLISLILFSCQKDVAIPESHGHGGTVTPVVPFIPLTIGSFWVYNYYQVDTNGSESYMNTDTVIIIKDSIINEKKYAVFKGSYEQKCNYCFEFKRDSSGYLVDEMGLIRFSTTNFTDTLEKFILDPYGGILYYKMNHKDSTISVPAGHFITSECERVEYIPFSSPKAQHSGAFFSYGVGIVKNRLKYFGPPNYYDSKLVSYYIAP